MQCGGEETLVVNEADAGGGITSFFSSSAEYPACRRVPASYPCFNRCFARHPAALEANASESNGNSRINEWAAALLVKRHFCCSVKTALGAPGDGSGAAGAVTGRLVKATHMAALPAHESCLTETFSDCGGGALIAVLGRTLEGACGRLGWLEMEGSARGLRLPLPGVRVRGGSILRRLGGWVQLLRSGLGSLNCGRPRAIPGPRVAQRSSATIGALRSVPLHLTLHRQRLQKFKRVQPSGRQLLKRFKPGTDGRINRTLPATHRT